MNSVISFITALIMFFSMIPSYLSGMHATEIIRPESDAAEVRIMSSNVRYFNITKDTGERSWLNRAGLLVQGIENYAPDIIGFQEVTDVQYSYLKTVLDQYDSVRTRRDYLPNSESCPVFFRNDLYELEDKGSFWLSETPEKMSKDWDSGCYRICSYVVLKQKETGKEFAVFNAHLDNASEEARIKGIDVVLNKIKEFGSLPSILMGDFNAYEDSETYAKATENFYDLKYLTDDPDIGCTFQAFGEDPVVEVFDYFMITKTGFEAEYYQRVTDTYDGVYSSDHYPIFAIVKLV